MFRAGHLNLAFQAPSIHTKEVHHDSDNDGSLMRLARAPAKKTNPDRKIQMQRELQELEFLAKQYGLRL